MRNVDFVACARGVKSGIERKTPLTICPTRVSNIVNISLAEQPGVEAQPPALRAPLARRDCGASCEQLADQAPKEAHLYGNRTEINAAPIQS